MKRMSLIVELSQFSYLGLYVRPGPINERIENKITVMELELASIDDKRF